MLVEHLVLYVYFYVQSNDEADVSLRGLIEVIREPVSSTVRLYSKDYGTTIR